MVSSAFDNEPSLMARHRLVHAALSEQLAGPVHALSIVAKTPAQFHAMTEGQTTFVMEPSPNCRGGDGSLPPKKGH